jgi:hypothetical protein
MAKSMMRKAPNARLKEIGGGGHFLMLGKPAEVANEIRCFFGRGAAVTGDSRPIPPVRRRRAPR